MRCIRVANKTIDRGVDIVVILILLIGLYFLADIVWVYMHSRADVTMPYKPTDGNMSVLKDLSEDCVGWITLDNTSIDYPIMQGEDNLEYLNKDSFGDYSLSGSIFLDSRNSSDFSDEYSIVYGHHMSGGYMFGALDDFEESRYFEEHETGTLYTERGNFPVQVICFLYTDASNALVFEPETDVAGLRLFMKEKAEQFRAADDGRIVALTTCKSPTSTRRACLFLHVVEDKLDEKTAEKLRKDREELGLPQDKAIGTDGDIEQGDADK